MATTTTVRAIRRNSFENVQLTSSGGNTQGDIVQLADGRIGVVEGLEAVADTDPMGVTVLGQFDILKNATTDVYALGAPVYYDPTNKVAKTAGAAGYYYAGRCVKASASGDVYVYTDINATEVNRLPTAAITAAGSVQGDAATLIEGINVVTGADGTKGVILPTAVPGMQVLIKGVTSAVLKVYPATGGAINAVAANGALSLTTGVMPTLLFASSATQWYTLPLVAS